MKKSVTLKLNDRFTPNEFEISRCDAKLNIWKEGESIYIRLEEKDKIISMGLPLYAGVALAQMVTGTLNGQKLLDSK